MSKYNTALYSLPTVMEKSWKHCLSTQIESTVLGGLKMNNIHQNKNSLVDQQTNQLWYGVFKRRLQVSRAPKSPN